MQMFTNAEIRKGTDEVKGDYISYDAVTEFYQVIGGPSVATPVIPRAGCGRRSSRPRRRRTSRAASARRKPAGAPETIHSLCDKPKEP